MIRFVYNSQSCRIEGKFPYPLVKRATSFAVPKAFFIKSRMKASGWDGRTHLMRRCRGPDGVMGYHFPTGLLKSVEDFLQKRDYRDFEYTELDTPPKLENNLIQLSGIKLRDYQQASVESMKKHGRGILNLATASGKTEIMIAYTQLCGLPTLFVVYGTDLVQQTYDRYKTRLSHWLATTGRKLGILKGPKQEDGDIVIASVSKLASMLKRDPQAFAEYVSKFDVLLLDECHMKGAKTFYNVCMNIPAYFRFGASGTPTYRSDGANKRVIGLTGPVIYKATNKQMAAKKVTAQATIEFIPCTEPASQGKEYWKEYYLKYPELYKKYIVQNSCRNTIMCQQTQKWVKTGHNVIILIREIEHGNILNRMLNGGALDLFDNGYKVSCEFLHGTHSSSQRDALKEKFKNKKLNVLIASSIFDQGVDFPDLDVLVLGGGGKSHIKTLQRIGRGLRGRFLHVVEFADKFHHIFKDQTLERLKYYKKEGAFNIVFSKSK